MKLLVCLIIIINILCHKAYASGLRSTEFECHSSGNGSASVSMLLHHNKSFALNIHVLGDPEKLTFSGIWTEKKNMYRLIFNKKHPALVIARLFPSKQDTIKMRQPHEGEFPKNSEKIDIWGVYCFKTKTKIKN